MHERTVNVANFNIANIKPPKAPNLPIPPIEYSPEYGNTLTNALRLYFNQIDVLCKYVVTPDIGQFFNFPFLAVLDTTVQTAASPATAYPITFDSPYLPSYYAAPNDSLPYLDPTDSSKIVIPNSHYYNFAYTINFIKVTSGPATVAVWFRLNSINYGVIDYPGTTKYYTLLGDGAVTAANCTIMVDEENGDSWQIMWTTSDADVFITPTPSGGIGPEPTGASAALAISYVSA
jgi:hypothetical protein